MNNGSDGETGVRPRETRVPHPNVVLFDVRVGFHSHVPRGPLRVTSIGTPVPPSTWLSAFHGQECPHHTNQLLLVLITVLRSTLRRIGCSRNRLLQIDQRQSRFLQLLVKYRNFFRLELAPRRQLLFQRLLNLDERRFLLSSRRGVSGIER